MASLTVRQLDEKLKRRLRLRAAKHGRSVEDEVRTILRSAAADAESFAGTAELAHGAEAPTEPVRKTAAHARRSHYRRRHRRL